MVMELSLQNTVWQKKQSVDFYEECCICLNFSTACSSDGIGLARIIVVLNSLTLSLWVLQKNVYKECIDYYTWKPSWYTLK